MPELPEVETVRRGLEPVMLGRSISDVVVRRRDLRWPIVQGLEERIGGAGIAALRRRSKYLLIDLEPGDTLIIHLGMSGRMKVSGACLGEFYQENSAPEAHDHVVFRLDGGVDVTLNDARRFGSVHLVETSSLNDHFLIRNLGPEPLGNAFDATYLKARFKGRASAIKTALLDQQVVAGLGNIYVCESLHRAGISPKRAARNVGQARLDELVRHIRNVLNEAIEAGGSSLRGHRQADGDLGYFQHSFQAYGRDGQPCQRPGCTGQIRRIVQSGRSTFYCGHCQR